MTVGPATLIGILAAGLATLVCLFGLVLVVVMLAGPLVRLP